jgi:peptidoglycan/xylan/chitin deacetylase (PgdA/CDA1 family)
MPGVVVFHKVLDKRDSDRFSIDTGEFNRIISVLRFQGNIISPENIRTASGKTFILTFDDGTIDHYDLINSHPELKCLFFINTDNVGKRGYLDKTQIFDLQSAGHTIGSHSHQHQPLTALSEKAIYDELETSLKHLDDFTGRKTEWFAPPEGLYDERVIEAAKESGIRYFRTTNFGDNNSLPLSDKGMFVLNSFNVGRYFMSGQLEKCLSDKAFYYKLYLAYKAKNFIKKHLPVLYRKARVATGY